MFAFGQKDNIQSISKDELRNELLKYMPKAAEQSENVCSDCGYDLALFDGEYICNGCGLIAESATKLHKTSKECADQSNTSHVIIKRCGRTYRYNVVNGPNINQMKADMVKYILTTLRDSDEKIEVPNSVIHETANEYYSIQEKMKKDGLVFVHRSIIRIEIIASIFYHLAQNAQSPVHKTAISNAFKLPVSFARGNSLLWRIQASGYTDIIRDNDVYAQLTEKYLRTLGLGDNEDNKIIVEKILTIARDNRIGINSTYSSQVAGAVYLLVYGRGLNIKAKDLEAACDGIKSATYLKFANEVRKKTGLFLPVFRMYKLTWR